MEFQRYEQEANELINAVRGMNTGYQQGYPQQNQFMNQGYPQQNQFPNQGYPQQNQFQQQPAQAAGWVCPFCGMQNSGNFCIGCGNQKQ